MTPYLKFEKGESWESWENGESENITFPTFPTFPFFDLAYQNTYIPSSVKKNYTFYKKINLKSAEPQEKRKKILSLGLKLSLTKSVQLMISRYFYKEIKKILRRHQPYFGDLLRNPSLGRN